MKRNLNFYFFILIMMSASILKAQSISSIEAESVSIGGKWKLSTMHAGFSGTGYLEWLGGDKFGKPTDSTSFLIYKFTVPVDGDYSVYIRGRRDWNYCGCPDSAASDACNDIFVKIDDGNWIKSLVKGPFGTWVWDQNFEMIHKKVEKSKFTLKAGEHTLMVTGRSAGVQLDGFKIDAFTSERPTGVLNCNK